MVELTTPQQTRIRIGLDTSVKGVQTPSITRESFGETDEEAVANFKALVALVYADFPPPSGVTA